MMQSIPRMAKPFSISSNRRLARACGFSFNRTENLSDLRLYR
jgi:hypothetical protein